jgi:hypothetical protein
VFSSQQEESLRQGDLRSRAQGGEDTSSNETLEQLGDMMNAKEGVERKLYTSYSMGRDQLGRSKIPLSCHCTMASIKATYFTAHKKRASPSLTR